MSSATSPPPLDPARIEGALLRLEEKLDSLTERVTPLSVHVDVHRQRLGDVDSRINELQKRTTELEKAVESIRPRVNPWVIAGVVVSGFVGICALVANIIIAVAK